jgi:hypothetical protein
MTFSYELGRPSLHFVKNHPAKFPLVDEVALRAALDSGHVAGAKACCSGIFIALLPFMLLHDFNLWLSCLSRKKTASVSAPAVSTTGTVGGC